MPSGSGALDEIVHLVADGLQVWFCKLGIRSYIFTLARQRGRNERGEHGNGNGAQDGILFKTAAQGKTVHIGHLDIADNPLHEIGDALFRFLGFLFVFLHEIPCFLAVCNLGHIEAPFLFKLAVD